MIVNLPFEIGETVYYIVLNGMRRGNVVKTANVFGYSIYKKNGEIIMGVNFKSDNNVPIEYVSRDVKEVEIKCKLLNNELTKLFPKERRI